MRKRVSTQPLAVAAMQFLEASGLLKDENYEAQKKLVRVFALGYRGAESDFGVGSTEARDQAPAGELARERAIPRDQRQVLITNWARMAFGEAEATGIPQRGLRLLEEAIEAFQACGCDEAIAHKLVKYVFERPPGKIGQELGGVAVTVLALAAAAGLSADEEECREIHRVLSKPLREFTERNASKNAAGFKIP